MKISLLPVVVALASVGACVPDPTQRADSADSVPDPGIVVARDAQTDAAVDDASSTADEGSSTAAREVWSPPSAVTLPASCVPWDPADPYAPVCEWADRVSVIGWGTIESFRPLLNLPSEWLAGGAPDDATWCDELVNSAYGVLRVKRDGLLYGATGTDRMEILVSSHHYGNWDPAPRQGFGSSEYDTCRPDGCDDTPPLASGRQVGFLAQRLVGDRYLLGDMLFGSGYTDIRPEDPVIFQRPVLDEQCGGGLDPALLGSVDTLARALDECADPAADAVHRAGERDPRLLDRTMGCLAGWPEPEPDPEDELPPDEIPVDRLPVELRGNADPRAGR